MKTGDTKRRMIHIRFPKCTLTAVAGLMVSTTLLAQTPAKPKVQTSAKPEQTTVFVGNTKGGASKTAKAKPEEKNTKNNNNKTAKARQGGKNAKASLKRGNKRGSKESLNGRYVARKTNVAYDSLALMKLGLEIQVAPKVSVELPVIWSLWDYEQEHGIRTVAIQPEARWWMGRETGYGHYFGLHAHVAWFNVKWNDTRYQDTERPLLGAGLSYGYKLPLSEHWGAEFSLGLGYANMKYNTYYNIDNGACLDTRVRHYWGITRLGASLVYRF